MATPSAPSSALAALSGIELGEAGSSECHVMLSSARQVRGWLDAVEAQVTSRLSTLHDVAGGAPAADVHTRCGGVSAAEGKRKERRSRTIDEAPSFGEALLNGDVGSEHVDALAGVTSKVDDDVRAQLLDQQHDLVDAATSMTPEQFGRHCRNRVRSLEHDNGVDRNHRQRNDTYLSRKINMATGMIDGRFSFHPELADQIFGAVDHEVRAMIAVGERAGDPQFADRSIDRNRLAAEALGHLVAGGHQQVRPLDADITYVIDHQTAATGELHDHSICETGSGLPVPPSSIRQMMCNGRITPIIVDAEGHALDAGRTIRHANRSQRRALRAMYRTCAFGTCDAAFDRCEIHHLIPWNQGGQTDLRNLLPLCSRHHHVIHLGWRLHLAPDRTLTSTQPDGTVFATDRPDVPIRRSSRDRRGGRRSAA